MSRPTRGARPAGVRAGQHDVARATGHKTPDHLRGPDRIAGDRRGQPCRQLVSRKASAGPATARKEPTGLGQSGEQPYPLMAPSAVGCLPLFGGVMLNGCPSLASHRARTTVTESPPPPRLIAGLRSS